MSRNAARRRPVAGFGVAEGVGAGDAPSDVAGNDDGGVGAGAGGAAWLGVTGVVTVIAEIRGG